MVAALAKELVMSLVLMRALLRYVDLLYDVEAENACPR